MKIFSTACHLSGVLQKTLFICGTFFGIVNACGATGTVLGEVNNPLGSTTIYTYDDGTLYAVPNWEITNGTLITSSKTGTLYSATVQWSMTSGTGIVEFKSKLILIANRAVNVGSQTPTPTGSFTYASKCDVPGPGVTVITRTDTPPANVTWYWQSFDLDGPQGTNTTRGSGLSIDAQETEGYYLRAYSATYGWSDNRLPANAIPPMPTNLTATSACVGGSATLSADAQGALMHWYTACSGGTPVFTGTGPFTTPPLTSNKTYYVATYFPTGEESPRKVITATVLPGVTAPSASSNPTSLCGGGTVALTASGNGANESIRWYATATGNTLLPSDHPTVSQTTDFYAAKFNLQNGCESPRTPVTVTVWPLPPAPTVADAYRFGPGSVTVTASGAPAGGSYAWYFSSQPQLQASTASWTIPYPVYASSANFAYVKTFSAQGCESPTTWASITIYPLPVISATHNYIVKQGNETLTTDVYDSYTWKDSNGVVVGTTRDFLTNVPGTYTVTVTKNGVGGTSEPFRLNSQFDGQHINYIITNTTQIANLNDVEAIEGLPLTSVTQEIQYFDGLGRHIQTVAAQGSPGQKDIIQPTVYDEVGRETKKYLPVTAENNGRYKEGIIDASGNYTSIALNYYNNGAADKIADDSRPFAETVFEASPLNRPAQQFGVGAAWKDNNKYVGYKYGVNIFGTASGQEKIVAYKIDGNGNLSRQLAVAGSIETGGYYSSNRLRVTITIDEQGNAVREYTDNNGKVVLKKVQVVAGSTDLNNISEWAFTYYVYDNFGNLVTVVPPEAVKVLGN